MNNFKKHILIASTFLPSLVMADDRIRNIDSSSATTLVESIAKVLNTWIIPLLILLALAYFIFGVLTYIGEREDAKREEKKQKMFWGLVALFIMLSVWSLVFVISNTFNIDTTSNNSGFYETFG